ncbi:MAG: hypothetical protein K0U37_01315 [Gammaproteobacteria bacterium]|nr:hypothetical protein [Gammaproteobacteria bacterium]
MIQKNVTESEEKIKRLFVQVWDNLEVLNNNLRMLQNEVESEDLEMTIMLIEGRLSLDGTDAKLLVQYLSVILMEVSCFLSDIIDEKNDTLSDEGIEVLKNVGDILKDFRSTSKFLQVGKVHLDK